jgi:hypothetical protein
MNFKMADVKGVSPDHASKLLAAGVENTDEMMRVWNDPGLRASVCSKCGIDEAQLTRLVSIARMARMKGVGPKYAELLVTAGITGRRSLSTYTSSTLQKRLAEVSAATNRPGPIPSLTEIDSWFAELKPIVG